MNGPNNDNSEVEIMLVYPEMKKAVTEVTA